MPGRWKSAKSTNSTGEDEIIAEGISRPVSSVRNRQPQKYILKLGTLVFGCFSFLGSFLITSQMMIGSIRQIPTISMGMLLTFVDLFGVIVNDQRTAAIPMAATVSKAARRGFLRRMIMFLTSEKMLFIVQ